jgi:hypothetical protein
MAVAAVELRSIQLVAQMALVALVAAAQETEMLMQLQEQLILAALVAV